MDTLDSREADRWIVSSTVQLAALTVPPIFHTVCSPWLYISIKNTHGMYRSSSFSDK